MSKVTITFDMPEEADSCQMALRGGQLFSALCSIDNLARNVLKHGDGGGKHDALIEIRELVAEALEGLR